MTPRILRRRHIVAFAAAGACLLLVAGWTAASTFQSPAQREAAAKAPPPNPVTAVVERGDLNRSISFRGQVDRAEKLVAPLHTIDEGTGFITGHVRTAGESVAAGDLLTEVNGRPVFVIAGAFPFYRPLTTGDQGPDVRQLQAGLNAAGLGPQADGVFGAATESAIRALYQLSGYRAEERPVDTGPSSDEDGSERADSQRPREKTVTVSPDALSVVAALPAVVAAAPPVGSAVSDGTAVTLGRGPAQIAGEVPELSAIGITGRTQGEFAAEGIASIPVRVESVEVGAEKGQRSVRLSGDALDGALGKAGLVTLDIDVVARKALKVPTVAVAPGGRGAAHVLVERSDGRFDRVTVRELGELDGTSAVAGTGLHVGDRVRVDR